MIWGTHPDSITMSMVSKTAAEQAGGTGTLDYLKAYRASYELAAFGEHGTLEYILELDAFIADWEAGRRPSTEKLCVPLMGFADTRLPHQKRSLGSALERFRKMILKGGDEAKLPVGAKQDC